MSSAKCARSSVVERLSVDDTCYNYGAAAQIWELVVESGKFEEAPLITKEDVEQERVRLGKVPAPMMKLASEEAQVCYSTSSLIVPLCSSPCCCWLEHMKSKFVVRIKITIFVTGSCGGDDWSRELPTVVGQCGGSSARLGVWADDHLRGRVPSVEEET